VLIERILAPLIENAYRYARTSVTVTIEQDGATVRFAVQDDGAGIPDSEREAIFEPGRRGAPAPATGATALASTGAGLGLALTRRLARTAGGDVTAEHSDAGGRFVVELPAA
jgi:signal transduction histidine kinase